MAALDVLAALGGPWQATYQLRGDPSFESDSPSAATVSPILGGRFVRVDYTWSDRGRPQEGMLVIGHEPETGTVTAVWLDTWHNGNRMMVCTGHMLPQGGIDVRGTYPAGPGHPDWGWHTRVELRGTTWAMTMFNVSPDGDEALAVTADYRRP